MPLRLLSALFLILGVALGCQTTRNAIDDVLPFTKESHASVRALWVTRFDFRTESDVVRIFEDCQRAGFETVLFQVRGNATALYRSSFEPWAEQLGGQDPGFDPLEVALREGRARNIRVCAWVNVMPAWWGTEPPTDPEQLYSARPEWMWYDQNGARQALCDKFYVSVNPCLPEVRTYLVDVLRDLVARYRIDGLHLDYLRFPNEAPGTPAGSGLDYPRDERTLHTFLGATGKTPEQDPAAWRAWRTEQVTLLVEKIHHMVERTRPGLEVSCAVGPVPETALREHFQDARTWLAQGFVDRLYPMNYARDTATFDERVERWQGIGTPSQVVMGVRVDLADPFTHRAQITRAREEFAGFAVFAYQSLFDSPNEALVDQSAKARDERRLRRETFLPFLRNLAGLR
jgi:uncharacterized lipoprotein YddW (UPF0748 family)